MLSSTDVSFTGERIVPGLTPVQVFREHLMRYRFAAEFVRQQIVLDVASGTGIGTDFLRKSGAKACIGVELDPAAVQYAAASYPTCKFIRGDACQLGLRDATIDVIVSFETIEHLPDPERFLEECRRVLRPKGVLICSTPNRAVYSWGGRNPFHVRELYLEEFRRFIEDRFENCQLYGQVEVNYPVYASRRVMSRFLQRIRLKGLIDRVLERPVGEKAAQTEFDGEAFIPEFEVKPMVSTSFLKPVYLVAVAQKEA